jgi:enoyl-CoA hydratase
VSVVESEDPATAGDESGYERLSVVVDDGSVAELTLTRPDLLNRFDKLLHLEFTQALLALRSRPDVRALIMASTGKVFSAGGDFDWILELNSDLSARIAATDEARVLFETLIDLPFPVIAAVQGDAIGLGASIVLGCDIVVASQNASLADPHVAIGLVAGDGGCVSWPAAAGMLRAKRYLLTGDRIRAAEAAAMGLVTDLVDDADAVLPAARALAGRIAAMPPLAVQGTKRALNQLMQHRAAEVLTLSLANEAQSMASEDLVEAISAYRAQRTPSYRRR